MDIFLWSNTYPSLLSPSLIGLLGWLGLLATVIWVVWYWRHFQAAWFGRVWAIFFGLLVLQVILTLFFPQQRLPVGDSLSIPNSPLGSKGPALVFLSALPWLLAGGVLGPLAGALLGLSAGLLRFLWDSHSIFTPLEFALLGALFGLMVRQRYRTRPFRLISEPLVAAFFLALCYIPIYIIDSFLIVTGPTFPLAERSISLANGLIYAISSAPYAILAVASELLIGGTIAQTLAIFFPSPWGRRLPLQPSPTERSLEARFLFGTGTLIIVLLIALLVGDWFVAGSAARQMLMNRMKGTAELAAESVPFFLETGQNLASQLSQNPDLLTATGPELSALLGEQIRSVPYFDQLLVLDRGKKVMGSYPDASGSQLNLFSVENTGIDLAFSGVLSQTYSIPPAEAGQPARISFIIALVDFSTGQADRILIGRTNLATNPFTQPLINSLKAMSAPELGGKGILLDENKRILYHPQFSSVMEDYSGRQETVASFFDDTAPDGTGNLVYYQPVKGRAWSVVVTVPTQLAQQKALDIAAPLSGMIIVLAFIALVSLRVGLKVVTTSLQNLANEAVRIAQGQLDHALTVEGVDEVGQLRRAFEQMRVSLQSRLEELNRLLLVSQGVASSLDMRDAVQPVMEAVLATGANAVRVVMPPLGDDSEQDKVSIFALGPSKEKYAYMDEHVTRLAQQQERVVLTNVARARGLEVTTGKLAPASLIAVSLRHENRHYGVLWAAYDQSRLFSETDVRFLTTLAGQAALAASNNHLFRTAEVGRQRLAAILQSTPDPVLVTDQYNRLLLSNPAAWQALGAAIGTGEGQPIDKLVAQKPLLDILNVDSPDKLSAEVTLLNGQIYLATASPVVADGRQMGRICILRDVTHFKQLDTMKTEFVSTVSHDLRSPLTLMRGYATMLEMVGTLNEQQQGYVKKIIFGVENMARMVNNLLDLGRIDAGVGLQLQTIPLVDILDRVGNTLQPQAAQKNIELFVDMPKNTMPLIEADPALLEQAMYNLVENAIKYTPQNGKVSARLKIIGDSMQFEVEDTGIGIAPLDQPRIFEKFYRGGQREAREQKGSGLGLAIVRSIAERHGGKVWLESQLGKGSTFFLHVPLHQPKDKRA